MGDKKLDFYIIERLIYFDFGLIERKSALTFFNIETIVKKTVFLFIAISTTLFCQLTDPSYKWYPVTELIEKANKLKTGDILVLSKQHTILQSQGHVAVINENMKKSL